MRFAASTEIREPVTTMALFLLRRFCIRIRSNLRMSGKRQAADSSEKNGVARKLVRLHDVSLFSGRCDIGFVRLKLKH